MRAGLGLALVPILAADESLDPFSIPMGPPLIRVQVEFVEMEHGALSRLMAEPRNSTDDTRLRAKVEALVKKGDATVVETMMCLARDGEKATSESIEEFIYPTEYEPAELPSQLRVTPSTPEHLEWLREMATGPTPTAFETRNLGSTLQVEPSLNEAMDLIRLKLAPEIVYHVKNDIWTEWKDTRGESHIQMPTMYTMRLNTSAALQDGSPLLVAAVSPHGKDGYPDYSRKVMVFVRCDVLHQTARAGER